MGMRTCVIVSLAITFIAGVAGLLYYFRYDLGICDKGSAPKVPDVVTNCWVNKQGGAQPYLVALLVLAWLLVLCILAYYLLKSKQHEDEAMGIRYLIDVEYGVDMELAKKSPRGKEEEEEEGQEA